MSSTTSMADSDTIELFSREDIRYLSVRNRLNSGQQFWSYPILSILLILVIGLSALTLYRFGHHISGGIDGQISVEVFDNSSDFVFNYDPHNHPIEEGSTPVGPQCRNIEPNDRLDCNPDDPIAKDVCLRRGCCWTEGRQLVLNSSTGKPPLNVPFCYFPSDFVGYNVTSVETYAYQTVVTLDRRIGSGFLRDSQTVKLEVTEFNDYSVRYFV